MNILILYCYDKCTDDVTDTSQGGIAHEIT